MHWLGFGRNSEKELDAFRARKLDALIDSIPIPTPEEVARLQELDRVYRELEAQFDSLVLELDVLQGNGDRGCRGEYYFMNAEQAINGIRRLRQNIIDKTAEIAIERESIATQQRARNYSEDTEAEINAICAAHNIQGLKTL